MAVNAEGDLTALQKLARGWHNFWNTKIDITVPRTPIGVIPQTSEDAAPDTHQETVGQATGKAVGAATAPLLLTGAISSLPATLAGVGAGAAAGAAGQAIGSGVTNWLGGDEYTQEMFGDLGGFAGGMIGGGAGIKGFKLATSNAQKFRLANKLNRSINATKLNPTEIDKAVLSGKVGWAPAQDITWRHGSDNPALREFVPYNRWDVLNRGASPYQYFVTRQGSSTNMMDGRPYQYTGVFHSSKPMVQLNEFNIAGQKNATRNQLLSQARSRGADSYILENIADNKAKNQDVVVRFIDSKGEPIYPQLSEQSPSNSRTLTESKGVVSRMVEPTTNTSTGRTSLAFYERPSAVSNFEKLGIPKHDRKQLGSFKSDLNWDAREWFNLRKTLEGEQKYNAFDIMSLQNHLPEYLHIEQLSKNRGNWLKNSDGSNFVGDPRSWVQLRSQNGRFFDETPIYSGIKTPAIDPSYNGHFWGTYGQGKNSAYQARAYAASDDHVLELVTPKYAKTYNAGDQQGRVWFDLKNEYDITRTNDLAEWAFKNGYDRININNVLDVGPNSGHLSKSKYKIYDSPIDDHFIMSSLPQNDVVVDAGLARKSILGNNGNFNIHDRNIYRKHGGKMNYIDFFKSGGIHIKKKNEGKFTASAKAAGESVQEHAHKVMNDPNATALQKKRANFAIQAKRWAHKHQTGGRVFMQATKVKSDDSTPLTRLWDFVSNYSEPEKLTITSTESPKDQDFSGYTLLGTPVSKSAGKMHQDLTDLQNLFTKYNLPITITSGYREGAVTSNGSPSFHASGEAMDIVPTEGHTFQEIADIIRNTPEIANFMKSHKLGVLDETSKEMLARTGGTGAHYHVGRDKNAYKFWQV